MDGAYTCGVRVRNPVHGDPRAARQYARPGPAHGDRARRDALVAPREEPRAERGEQREVDADALKRLPPAVDSFYFFDMTRLLKEGRGWIAQTRKSHVAGLKRGTGP